MSEYSFIGYVAACSISLLLCWVAYRLFLEFKTSPKYNRIIIMVIFLLMMVIPATVNLHFPQLNTSHDIETSNKMMVPAILPDVFSYHVKELRHAIPIIFLWLYLIGAGVVGALSLINIGRLWKIHRSSTPEIIDGICVYMLQRDDLAPFSWHNRIYVNKDLFNLDENERRPLLLHEQSHIERLHYLDLILTEMVAIFQWFNPAAWKLRNEIKMLHEYEADQAVLASGIDEKEYQYLLINNLVKITFRGMTHGINGSHLEKRILTMHKKHFRKGIWMRATVILIAAVIAAFILNIPAIASSLRRPIIAYQITRKPNNIDAPLFQANAARIVDTLETTATNKIYENPDVLPMYGKEHESTDALMKDLATVISYPGKAQKNGIQGKVVVGFIVNEMGEMEGFQIMKSVDPELDETAIEGIKKLPRKWQPATVGGKPVASLFYLPVTFLLQDKV